MGNTIIEKIFASHTQDEVKPGNVIWLNIDVRTARDFGGPKVVKNLETYFDEPLVADPSKTFFTFDTNAPAKTIAYATNQHICRLFARRHGIKIFDVDRGIGSHVMIEEGIIRPGMTLVGTDSHLNIMGSIGAFGQGMGDVDIAFAFKTGKVWFEVPHTVKINLKGTFNYPTTPKDLVLFLVGHFTAKGLLGLAAELYGEAVDNLNLSGRITVASMGTEMGAISLFIPPNEKILKDLQQFAKKQSVTPVYADSDAEYLKEYEIDVTDLPPMVALPYSPDNVKPVDEVKDVKIDSVFVGSCTNGRIEDMRAVAEILKDNKVADGVMLRIVPATREVWGQMLREGLMDIMFKAGAIISNPGCGGCAEGQIGMTGENEIQLSTSNRNFKGKQGKGQTYLVSPAVAAASAVAGYLISPSKL